jgi:cell filamentation protein
MMDGYSYEYEQDSHYCYPGSDVLINKLNIGDAEDFAEVERRITGVRILEALEHPIKGNLDLAHLCSIHRFIFRDIYDWAGELRDVNISKGNPFCQCAYLVDYADELFVKLKNEKYLTTASADELPKRLAYYISEINVLHPFREGNGRTQRIFIEYLARGCGYHLDFTTVTDDEMIEASVKAFDMDYGMMEAMMQRIISPMAKINSD